MNGDKHSQIANGSTAGVAASVEASSESVVQERQGKSAVSSDKKVLPVEQTPTVIHQTTTAFDEDTYMEKGTPEHAIQEKFMTPHLSGLEKAVLRNNVEFEKIEQQMREEREEMRRERLSEHIPDAIKGSGQSIQDIINHLEALIVYEDFDPAIQDQSTFKQTKMRDLDEAANYVILSYSIAAYVSTLDIGHVQNLANRLTADVQLWLSRLFRCSDMAVHSHHEERQGLVNVCKYLLHTRYSKFSEEGYEALYPRPPVIYISAAAKAGLGTHICCKLGLPLSCLKVVPCNAGTGSQEKMSVEALKQLVNDDRAAGRTPLLVFAHAGTPLCGHTDDLEKIQILCKEANIWLHVEGDNLSVLTLYQPPASVSPAQSGNSLTLNLARWTGLPTVPYVTLYNEPEEAGAASAAGLLPGEPLSRLHCLPLWLTLQHLGHKGFVRRVEFCNGMAKKLRSLVKETPELCLVDKRKQAEKKEKSGSTGLGDLLGRAISAIFQFEPMCPVVVFRFFVKDPQTNLTHAEPEVASYAQPEVGRETAPYAAGNQSAAEASPRPLEAEEEEKEEEEEEAVGTEYYDALNIWLYERLKQRVTRMRTESVEVEAEGVCIKFAPLETAHNWGTTEEDVDTFIAELKTAVSILSSTVQQRRVYRQLAREQPEIALVHIPGWAGLGAVQYVPKSLRGMSPDQFSEHGWNELDAINMEMVHKMKARDSAFSLGRSSYGHACVRFGLVSRGTDVALLLQTVAEVGEEVEESSRYLEKVSDLVKQGIEEANRKLQEDQQNKLKEQGVLRQVPLVSRVFNWWSPPPKDSSVGKAFNLQSGRVETTETTYKYHMQVADSRDTSRRSSVQSTPSSSQPTSPRDALASPAAPVASAEQPQQ